MFTGIIEAIGLVTALEKEGSNLHLSLSSPFIGELKIDQSIAHNGVCLTVVDIQQRHYTVTAIQETLQKTNLGTLKVGDKVNLERCMQLGARLDGHMVQGHVDQTAVCEEIQDKIGSWLFRFSHVPGGFFTVEKGSICVNGVSLTVVDARIDGFSVAIIPYTFEHTNFSALTVGSEVNIEFDIIGKYISKWLKHHKL